MQFLGSKIVSALIFLNTTICLAMQSSSEYDPYDIGIGYAACENRVYSKMQISIAIMGGLESHSLMENFNMKLDAVQYTPQPTEVMPSKDKFYFSELKRLGRNGPKDLVIFSRNGLFAKVVTRIRDSQGFKYKDCVPSWTTPFPQEYQPILGFPGQNSGVLDPLGIGITSVSCEGRVYNKRQISMAILRGMRSYARLNKARMNPDIMQYKPKSTEVMPSQEKFYFSEFKKRRANRPVDLVIFSASGQFAKVVILKEDGDYPIHKDCVSSPDRKYPERGLSRMRSLERPYLRTESFKRRRLGMKSPEEESFE